MHRVPVNIVSETKSSGPDSVLPFTLRDAFQFLDRMLPRLVIWIGIQDPDNLTEAG